MTERSIFWTDSTGHGGPYTQDQMRLINRVLAGADDGVAPGLRSEYAVSINGSDLRTAPGNAVVNGTVAESDANVDKTPAVPVVGTTGLRIVLRKGWTAQTVTVELLTNTDGTAAAPAVTQTDGTTWEISLATAEITTGGTIQNLIDTRTWLTPGPTFGLKYDPMPSRYLFMAFVAPQSSITDRTPVGLGCFFSQANSGQIDERNDSRTRFVQAVANSRATIGHGVSAAGTMKPNRSPDLIIRAVPKQTSANLSVWMMGFPQSASGTTNNGAYFRRATTGNVFAVTRQGGVETTTDLGALSDTTMRKWRVFTADAGVTWVFEIDDTEVARHTTNVPTVTVDLFPLITVVSNGSGSAGNDFELERMVGFADAV